MKVSKRNACKSLSGIELLERRELLSVAHASRSSNLISRAKVNSACCDGASARRHVDKAVAKVSPASTATFIDPTAVIRGARAIAFGNQDYVAPYATLTVERGGTIRIGNLSNVQDNVNISAVGRQAKVVIGDQAILAHNATIIGPATIGAPGEAASGVCRL